MDVYAGSGTTLAVAEKMGRRWLGCDIGAASIGIVRRRLLGLERPAAFRIARPDGAARVAGASERGTATAAVRVHEDREGVRLELTAVDGEARGLRGSGKALGWVESVDAWMVDFSPGEVFSPTFVAHRARSGTVPLETPTIPRARLGASARVVVHTVYGASATVDVPLWGAG
jgi:hypothetical protein